MNPSQRKSEADHGRLVEMVQCRVWEKVFEQFVAGRKSLAPVSLWQPEQGVYLPVPLAELSGLKFNVKAPIAYVQLIEPKFKT